MTPVDDPVLKRFRGALDAVYGDRIDRVVLFGSRARGHARPGSDYDIAVFLKSVDALGTEAGRLADIETAILLETEAIINAMPLSSAAYAHRTGFMGEVRRDGLEV